MNPSRVSVFPMMARQLLHVLLAKVRPVKRTSSNHISPSLARSRLS